MSLFWQIYRRPIFTARADVAGNRGMKAFKKKYSRAFTLYELIISIVLFALVASLVITFITYMSAFSEKNSAATQRVREQLALRKEIDFWVFRLRRGKLFSFRRTARGQAAARRG